MSNGGYTEWIRNDGNYAVIANCFKRILYINPQYPDGIYTKAIGPITRMVPSLEKHFKLCRTLTKDDLMLELL